ncbi:hypothetical protein LSAT2_025393, partial [Lamellibrachia satsuma]
MGRTKDATTKTKFFRCQTSDVLLRKCLQDTILMLT